MTAEQGQLVKSSWRGLRGIPGGVIGDLFYTKLFFEHPRLKQLFPADMQKQNEKLVDMLDYIVSRADDLGSVQEDIIAMAVRHKDYGVKAEHFDMIGKALMWTLEKAMSESWNPDLQNAWAACYRLLSEMMIDAMKA